MEKHLQLPDKLSCSVDLATATGKSWVLYGVGAILLAEGAVDRALVLCPSNTIEAGLIEEIRHPGAEARPPDPFPAATKGPASENIQRFGDIPGGSACLGHLPCNSGA